MKTGKYFWSDLAEIDSIASELDSLELSKSEKKELATLAHMQVHQAVVDTILSHLTEVDKKRFLELLVLGEDDKIWDHLNKRVKKIEEKISTAANQVKKELKEDIKKIKA